MSTIHDLLQIANERLADAEALFTKGRFTGAVYISGYVLECFFKALACQYLQLSKLPEMLQTPASHKPENIFELVPAIERDMQMNRTVKEAYARIISKTARLRYSTQTFKRSDVAHHLNNVREVKKWTLKKLQEKRKP